MPTNPAYVRTTTPMAVAIDHSHGFKPVIRNRRFRLRSFPHPDFNLLDLDPSNLSQPPKKSPTATSSFHRSFSTPSQLTAAKSDEALSDHITRVEIIGGRRAYGVYALVVEAAIAMASGAQPVPAPGGLGGAYYLHNRAGESFAVVKPIDEDPLGLSNSGGFSGYVIGQPGFRRSIRAGETGLCEVAAYLLDHDGFSGVPPTALVKMSHPAFHVNSSALPRKIASIQRFVAHDFDSGDLGPSRFSVSSVHRIGILDVRLLNIDRHAGNILVKKSSGNSEGSEGYGNGGAAAAELVPIDHGLCLPELLEDPYFEWLHWPQAAVPFSEQEAEYISTLDPFKDAELLRAELPLLREASIRILVLCTIFLKRAAAAGLCLAEIGDMMTREFCGLEEGPSVIEILCKEVQNGMDDHGERGTEVVAGDEPEEPQFEMDCDGDGGGLFTETHVEQVVELPRLLQGRPPKIPNSSKQPRIRSRSGDSLKGLCPLHDDQVEESGDGRTDESKVGGLTKSVSFSSPAGGQEYGVVSGIKCISFSGLSEEEWKVFLEKFEELLPGAFAVRKSLGLNHRLGTSCKF